MNKTIALFSMILLTGFLASAQLASSTTLDQLKIKRQTVKGWVLFCEDGSMSHGNCPFGDMTIFSGMSCLAGDMDRCDDVKRAQGPDGRWYRSPQLVGNTTETDSFSRDQTYGMMSYLIATHDTAAALRWQKYVESIGLKLCPDATNNRCNITLGIKVVMTAVWDYLGLDVPKWMKRKEWILSVYDPIQTWLQPADFPMHLSALSVWILRNVEERGGKPVKKYNDRVINILNKREPNNPFFLLLKDGPTEKVADLILRYCPDTKPNASLLDWGWQRSIKQGDVLKNFSGHECIFIINLFEDMLLKSTSQN